MTTDNPSHSSMDFNNSQPSNVSIRFTQRKLETLFVIGLLSALLFYIIRQVVAYKTDTAYGQSHGCQHPPELSYSWPLGVDRIKQLWVSNAEGRLLEFLCSIAKDYEPRNMLSQYLLFGPRAFHILHPQNLEVVLSTNFRDYGFGARPGVFAPLFSNGISTQEGAAWKLSRELLRKQFVRTHYQKLEHFSEHVDNLITNLPHDGIVDLQPLFFNLTLDIATDLLFGRSVYSLRAGIDQDVRNRVFAESFNIAQEGLAKRFRLAPWHFVYSPSGFRQACSNVHRFVEDYIDTRKVHKNGEHEAKTSFSFFDQVAEGSASDTDLRDQLLNVLLAGRDTTACCLSWTFRLLVRHPMVFERLRREVLDIIGSEPPTREHVRRMSYLACVIKESLRLYPPVPLNNRTAVRTTMLPTGGGPDGKSPILVRKGELVVFSQYVNSRVKSIYGLDANEFRPERWETGEMAGIGYAYFPFNGGPRQCLGEDFALMEVSYTVIRLIQEFAAITLPIDESVDNVGAERQLLTLVLSCADGCRVQLAKQ